MRSRPDHPFPEILAILLHHHLRPHLSILVIVLTGVVIISMLT
jgi:hypothetical protein